MIIGYHTLSVLTIYSRALVQTDNCPCCSKSGCFIRFKTTFCLVLLLLQSYGHWVVLRSLAEITLQTLFTLGECSGLLSTLSRVESDAFFNSCRVYKRKDTHIKVHKNTHIYMYLDLPQY